MNRAQNAVVESPLADDDLDLSLLNDVMFGDVLNPFPTLRKARREAPIQSGFAAGLIPDDGTNPNPVYTVYGYREAKEVLTNPVKFSSRLYADVFGPLLGRTLVGLDGAEHNRYRRILNPTLRRSTLQPVRADLGRTIAHSVVDRIASSGHADLIPEVALAYPIHVLSALMALGEESHAEFRRWAFDLMAFPADFNRGQCAAESLTHRLNHLLADRMDNPGEDVVSQLAKVVERLPYDDLLAFLLFLIPAGVESTFRSIGNMFHALIHHPDQFEQVRLDRSLLSSTVEEVLRWQPSVGVVLRTATETVEMGGIEIPRGADVVVCIASANHDERVFNAPDVFDIHRQEREPHLTFGFGPHACIGAALARYELTTLLDVFLDRIHNIRVVDEIPVKGLVLRSPPSLSIDFDAIADDRHSKRIHG